jgi:hypothetical protein
MEALKQNIEMRHRKIRRRNHRLMNALRTQGFSITTSKAVRHVSRLNGYLHLSLL